LNEFVVNAQAGGKRCVLVITGKGLSRGVGVLRQKLPQWIAMPPLRGLVLKSYPAVQRDGGTGAWYLYLKRDRGY
jgi:DNA-nicking Smr family endonuclease